MQVSVKLPMGKSHMKQIEIILPWETQWDTIIFGTGGKQYFKVVFSLICYQSWTYMEAQKRTFKLEILKKNPRWVQIPLDEAKPKNWISTERTKRRTPSQDGSYAHFYDCRRQERCRAGDREVSLTAECQNIAAGTRQDDYSPGKVPGLGKYIVCIDMVRFEEHYTEKYLNTFTSLGSGRAGTSQ